MDSVVIKGHPLVLEHFSQSRLSLSRCRETASLKLRKRILHVLGFSVVHERENRLQSFSCWFHLGFPNCLFPRWHKYLGPCDILCGRGEQYRTNASRPGNCVVRDVPSHLKHIKPVPHFLAVFSVSSSKFISLSTVKSVYFICQCFSCSIKIELSMNRVWNTSFIIYNWCL